MQYDFDTILDRRGRDALALDMIPYDGVEPKEGFSRIPMWVADMSFPTAPPVLEAIRARKALYKPGSLSRIVNIAVKLLAFIFW